MSKSTVQRGLSTPNCSRTDSNEYMARNDPEFESKAADIIALYLEPPQHVAGFRIDEKTAIQALDRLDPVLPLSPAALPASVRIGKEPFVTQSGCAGDVHKVSSFSWMSLTRGMFITADSAN